MSFSASWVWQYYVKDHATARCKLCEKNLKCNRSTSALIRHLNSKHRVYEDSPLLESRQKTPDSRESTADGSRGLPETELPDDDCKAMPPKKRRQSSIHEFVSPRQGMRSHILSMICVSNISLNQMVSEPIRRLLSRAYPNEPPPPKSTSTLTKYLREDADLVRDKLRGAFRKAEQEGNKLAISFDEATLIGSDRYLTLNVHHGEEILGRSKTAPLGLIRIKDRVTGEHLDEIIRERLDGMDLALRNISAVSSDGASNVQKAVRLMGLTQQKCFAHALDLVVKKVIYARAVDAFEIGILSTRDLEQEPALEDDESSSDDVDDSSDVDDLDDSNESNPTGFTITLAGALSRLRKIMRNCKKRPAMMDDLRKTTKRPEFNGKEMKAVLDSPTRWNSTLLMVERALMILPALNNMLSRHLDTPISPTDAAALRKIVDALAPFKRATLMLCEEKASLSHADTILRLLIRDLEKADSELGNKLLDTLKIEIAKRRTIASSAIAVLRDPKYDFHLEHKINVKKPTSKEILNFLQGIINTEANGLSETELIHSNAANQCELSWESVFSPSTSSDSAAKVSEFDPKEDLRKQFVRFRGGEEAGSLIKRCLRVLEAIPPTSVQCERDFSTVRFLLGEKRAKLSAETLNNIFVIRRALQCQMTVP